jgi:hypothetical protein
MRRVRARLVSAIGVLVIIVGVAALWVITASTGVFSVESIEIISCSPNASHCAFLARRTGRGNSSDVHYLRLRAMHNVFAWSHWADFGKGQQVLMTTEGGPTRLVWLGNDSLEAICDNCKLSILDVVREKKRSGSVIISYVGFPPPSAQTLTFPHS